MAAAVYVVAALEALSAIIVVGQVGKPRKVVTGPVAAGMVVIQAAVVTVLIIAAGRL